MRAYGLLLAAAAIAKAFPATTTNPASTFNISNVVVPPGTTATELEDGPCRRYTLIFARGTLETGNLVSVRLEQPLKVTRSD
jgi:hypothetical protein